MRIIAAFLLGGGAVWALPLADQDIYIRWAVLRYRVNEPLLRAVLRYENGRKGSEAGINPIMGPVDSHNADAVDVAAYCDPTTPPGAEQHARLARRIVGHVQQWVFNDPWRRRQWLKDWSKDYHAGGPACTDEEREAANREYYKRLAAVWAEERAKKP